MNNWSFSFHIPETVRETHALCLHQITNNNRSSTRYACIAVHQHAAAFASLFYKSKSFIEDVNDFAVWQVVKLDRFVRELLWIEVFNSSGNIQDVCHIMFIQRFQTLGNILGACAEKREKQNKIKTKVTNDSFNGFAYPPNAVEF